MRFSFVSVLSQMQPNTIKS